ncbi:MAG TPA: hypothetical protein VMF58_11075 [Rhizomicrobium sp.]|nr:hypothetical protein [Rhizomicrobium sp.]
MRRLACLIALCWLWLITGAAYAGDNALPAEFAQALSAPERMEIYSLEPTVIETNAAASFYGHKVLGHAPVAGDDMRTAAAEFSNAVKQWNGALGGCFEPRQALSIQYKTHRYDFVICFTCQVMLLYRDQKPGDEIGVTGSPDTLKALLIKLGVKPSNSDVEEERAREERWKKIEAAQTRWLAVMPPALRSTWDAQDPYEPIPDAAPFRAPLAKAIPDERERILTLLKWYGTDTDLWSGYSAYEDIPGDLLLDYPTARILEVAQSSALDNAQTEGLARFLAGWDFRKKRPNDLALVPPALKQTLLAHSLKSGDDDKKERARRAFSGD